MDSSVMYTLLPFRVWQDIGLTPKRSITLSLLGGSKIERQASECHISLEVGEGHTPVILGEPSDEAFLGIVTLEQMGFTLHALSRTLQPLRLRI